MFVPSSHVEVVSHFLAEGKERANIICLKAVQYLRGTPVWNKS